MTHPEPDFGEDAQPDQRQSLLTATHPWKETQTMQNRIPVISADGHPLAPCRPERAQQIVEQGKAVSQWREGIYHLRLTRRTREASVVPRQYELNIVPGSDCSGYAVSLTYPDGHRIPATLYERQHNSRAISLRLTQRRNHRRARRYHGPYRRPTGKDHHKPEGWLAPSQKHQLQQHQRLIDTLVALFPIGLIRIQAHRFDPTLMQNPRISAEEYQQGTLYGWELRAYVRHRDGYRCAYCDAGDTRLELDHIVPLAHGGASRVGNLTASCRRCNQRKADQPLEQFLSHDPQRAARIRRRADSRSFREPTQLNAMRLRLLAHAEQTGIPVRQTTGVVTAWQRRRLDIAKSKANDAVLLGPDFQTIGILPERCCALLNSAKPGKQKVNTDAHGTPAGRGYRDYQRLSRRAQSKTPTPGHAGKGKRHGTQQIATGDLIRLEHHRLGTVQGLAVVLPSSGRVRLRGTKPAITAPLTRTTLLHRRPAVTGAYPPPTVPTGPPR